MHAPASDPPGYGGARLAGEPRRPVQRAATLYELPKGTVSEQSISTHEKSRVGGPDSSCAGERATPAAPASSCKRVGGATSSL